MVVDDRSASLRAICPATGYRPEQSPAGAAVRQRKTDFLSAERSHGELRPLTLAVEKVELDAAENDCGNGSNPKQTAEVAQGKGLDVLSGRPREGSVG